MDASVDVLDRVIHNPVRVVLSQPIVGEEEVGVESCTSLDMARESPLAGLACDGLGRRRFGPRTPRSRMPHHSYLVFGAGYQ